MTDDARFTLLASYNTWMNQRLYAAAATLPHDALAADRGAFFGSILGTLNHLVVTDTIWLKRFAAAPDASPVLRMLDGIPMPRELDAMPYATLSALRARRAWLDALIPPHPEDTLFSQVACSIPLHDIELAELATRGEWTEFRP